jgi:hypothetical protein
VPRKSKRSRLSAQFKSKERNLPHNSLPNSQESSAQFVQGSKQTKSRLTRIGKKRGPKPNINRSEVVGRAYDFKRIFKLAGKKIDWVKLLAAQSVEDVEKAFELMDEVYRGKFLYKPRLLLECVKDKKFPKQDRNAQELFMAESLAGDGLVTIRRSRDICQEYRAERKRQGTIICREFYIECTCGYRGPAARGGCPNCGTKKLSADILRPLSASQKAIT